MLVKPAFIDQDLTNQRVFLRVDVNVPIVHGAIKGDYRLRMIQPTLDLLRLKKARIIVATHIGRPQGYDRTLTTRIIAHWLQEHGYEVTFAPDIPTAHQLSLELKPGSLLLLENLRFFPAEQREDWDFAKQLKSLADYYINDAFGTAHRRETSITLLPELFDEHEKSIGLLFEKELRALTPIRDHPQQPFLCLLGGGKPNKIPYFELLFKTVKVLLLTPGIVFTFLKAQGKEIGKSIYDEAFVEEAGDVLEAAYQENTQVFFPRDYFVALDSLNGPIVYCTENDFPRNGVGLSIGPATIRDYIQHINKAKTILVNGAMGFFDRPETMKSFDTLLQAVAQSNAYSVIAGGESVTAVYLNGLESAIDFCSTGGGSTLAFLAGYPLPGLVSLE